MSDSASRVKQATGEGRLRQARKLGATRAKNASAEKALIELLHAQAGNLAVSQLLGNGAPLPDNVRAEMEERFSEDFTRVRIHDDSTAHTSAALLGADAYTRETHIVFAPRRYFPTRLDGKRLIAHELAHVVQQSKGGAQPPRGRDAPHEQEADRAAAAVMQGNGGVQVSLGSAPGTPQFSEAPELPPAGITGTRDYLEQEPLIPEGGTLDAYLHGLAKIYRQAVQSNYSPAQLADFGGTVKLASLDADRIRLECLDDSWMAWLASTSRQRPLEGRNADAQWKLYEQGIRSAIAAGTDPESAIVDLYRSKADTIPESYEEAKMGGAPAGVSGFHVWESEIQTDIARYNRLVRAGQDKSMGLLIMAPSAMVDPPQSPEEVDRFLNAVDLADNIAAPIGDLYGAKAEGRAKPMEPSPAPGAAIEKQIGGTPPAAPGARSKPADHPAGQQPLQTVSTDPHSAALGSPETDLRVSAPPPPTVASTTRPLLPPGAGPANSQGQPGKTAVAGSGGVTATRPSLTAEPSPVSQSIEDVTPPPVEPRSEPQASSNALSMEGRVRRSPVPTVPPSTPGELVDLFPKRDSSPFHHFDEQRVPVEEAAEVPFKTAVGETSSPGSDLVPMASTDSPGGAGGNPSAKGTGGMLQPPQSGTRGRRLAYSSEPQTSNEPAGRSVSTRDPESPGELVELFPARDAATVDEPGPTASAGAAVPRGVSRRLPQFLDESEEEISDGPTDIGPSEASRGMPGQPQDEASIDREGPGGLRNDTFRRSRAALTLENNQVWGRFNEAELEAAFFTTLEGFWADPVAQVKIRPFEDNGRPAGFRFIPDFVARNLGTNLDELIDAKLTEGATLTDRQKRGYPLFARNGGVVVESSRPDLYPVGMRLPPAPTLRAEPTLDPRVRDEDAAVTFVFTHID